MKGDSERCAVCGKRKPKENIVHLAYTPYIVCNNCFSHLIERRVKHNIRFFGPLERGMLGFLEGNDYNKKIASFMLQKFFHPRFFRLVESKKEANVVMSCKSLEEICLDFLETVFHNKPLPISSVFLFIDIPQKELNLYASIHNIASKGLFTPKLPSLLEPIQNRFSFASSFKMLMKLKQKKKQGK